MNHTNSIFDSLVGNWDKIAVQGGELKRFQDDTVYLLSGIWVLCSNRWIEVSAVEKEPGEYWLSISVLGKPPIPEHSKINTPPRQLLTVFPKDCRIDKAITDGVQEVEVDQLEIIDGEFLVRRGLTVRCAFGDEFIFAASERFPCHIELRSI